MTFFAFGLCVVRVRTALYAFILCGTMLLSRDVGCAIFFRNRRHSAKFRLRNVAERAETRYRLACVGCRRVEYRQCVQQE